MMNAPKVKHCGTSLKTFKTDFLNHRRFTELIIHRWISITAGFIRFFILGLNPHPIFLPHIVFCHLEKRRRRSKKTFHACPILNGIEATATSARSKTTTTSD